MRMRWIMVPLMTGLVGCGDPLAGIERVSEMSDMPQDGAATALPTEAELSRNTPILAGLFRRSAPEAPPEAEAVAAPVPQAGAAEAGQTTADIATMPQEPDAATEQVAATPPKDQRGGVLGWLRRASAPEVPDAAPAPVVVAAMATQAPQSSPIKAELTPVVTVATPAPKPRGLFGRRGARAPLTQGPDARDVPVGTALPFGQIARVCDARGKQLGELVEQAARKGASYKLYDTEPGGVGPRTFYVTGFTDNCPRQFTASLALFGEPQMHEQLRYGLPAAEYPYSSTDQAYEKIKMQVCRVGRRKPCGPRVSRLARTTVFVSAYENFTENARWADMLLHEGAVLAKALKTP